MNGHQNDNTKDTLSTIQKIVKESNLQEGVITNPERIISPTNKVEKLVVEISPKVAEALLLATDESVQRKITQSSVFKYTELMKNGRFIYNHEPLIQDIHGNILNGRHRLTACVSSGVSIVMDMVKGANPNIMASLDDGRVRSGGDVISMQVNGKAYHGTVANAIAFLCGYIENKAVSRGGNVDRKTLSNFEMVQFVAKNLEVTYDLYDTAREIHKGKAFIPRGDAAGFYFLLSKINPTLARKFFIDGILLGLGITADSPIFYTRQKLIDSSNANRRNSLRLTKREKFILLIRAWNDYFTNDDKMSTKSYHVHVKTVPEIEGLELDNIGIEMIQNVTDDLKD